MVCTACLGLLAPVNRLATHTCKDLKDRTSRLRWVETWPPCMNSSCCACEPEDRKQENEEGLQEHAVLHTSLCVTEAFSLDMDIIHETMQGDCSCELWAMGYFEKCCRRRPRAQCIQPHLLSQVRWYYQVVYAPLTYAVSSNVHVDGK
jgi:hypothetical protein